MKRKIFFWTSAILVLILAGFVFFRFFFVFGEGVKAGELNFVVYKGYVFKTYEGRLIQEGFRGNNSTKTGAPAVQSYEFDFSVTDKAIADSLMRCAGKTVELSYKEYLGVLPWRGQQKYVVDGILAVH